MRQFQVKLRSLAEDLRVYVVRIRMHLSWGNYAEQVDTNILEAFEINFEQLIRDLDTPASRIRVRYRTSPPPPGEPVSLPETRFPGTKALSRQGSPVSLLQRSCMWVAISKRPPAASSAGRRMKNVLDQGRLPPDPLHFDPPATARF